MDVLDPERDRRSEDVQIAADVARIRQDIDKILHGNGRKGLWAISDVVFGAPGRANDDGLLGQVKVLAEAQVQDGAMREDVRQIHLKVDALERARSKDENLQEGRRRTLVALGAILTALSGLGATFGYQVMRAVGELTRVQP